MTQNYTLNDLVRLVYREASKAEASQLREEITYDYELAEEFTTLQKGARELPKVSFAPSKKCLDNILAYSRRTAFALN